jgi:predicted enzyme related to lactoylglutathione lyase
VGYGVPDLGAAIEELSSQGVSFTSGIEESGDARWIHFVDPEGNRLAIKQI